MKRGNFLKLIAGSVGAMLLPTTLLAKQKEYKIVNGNIIVNGIVDGEEFLIPRGKAIIFHSNSIMKNCKVVFQDLDFSQVNIKLIAGAKNVLIQDCFISLSWQRVL